MSSNAAPTDKVLNLSQYIFDRLDPLAPVEAIKMQKLLYYCQAWSLATRGLGIFPDRVQAWKHGPVVASIYPLHRGDIVLDNWVVGDGAKLSSEDQAIANAVIDVYGGFTGWELRDLTHREDPWKRAWEESGQGLIQGHEIKPKSMESYYRSKIHKK